ncbi:band 7 protein AGAP004871-like isoform X2 [Drosophila miranda]|uniref:band 7 protein AGAP004871-like isoform X2 n=1 Tax=Drosophila miranda TaxID=7229 RepID=UPI0007E7473D|nr:band 7 protein AGAP004871-like isoform X2 [Drosophila miranda]
MSYPTKPNNGTPPGRDIRWADTDDEPPTSPDPRPFKRPDEPPLGPPDPEPILGPRVKPSRYITTTEDNKNSGFEQIAVCLSLLLVVITFPLSIFLCLIVVRENHRVLIFRLGRVRKGVRGPGLVWTLPCIDSFVKVDLRTFSTEVPSQDILTRDSVTISVDAVLYFCIKDPMDALIQVDDAREATVLIAQTTLRHIVGAKPLHTLLTSRDTLSKEIQVAVDDITERWGVRVERVDVMDISLPLSMQRSLASEAEAIREARAKIISAEGERNASQALKEASDVMSQNQITLQLRHLQILTGIAAEHSCTIIFPFPMDVMTAFGTVEGSSKINQKPDGTDAGGENQTSDFDQFGDFTPKVIITEPPNLPEDLRFEESREEPETSNTQTREETERKAEIPESMQERKGEDAESLHEQTGMENDIKSSEGNSNNERKVETAAVAENDNRYDNPIQESRVKLILQPGPQLISTDSVKLEMKSVTIP